MLFKFQGFSCVVRPVVAYENLTFLQIYVAVNFDLDISTGTLFFPDKFRNEMRHGGIVLYICRHFKLQ